MAAAAETTLADRLYPRALAAQLSFDPGFLDGQSDGLLNEIRSTPSSETARLASLVSAAGALSTAEAVEIGASNLYLTMHDRDQETLAPNRLEQIRKGDYEQVRSIESGRSASFYYEIGADLFMPEESHGRAAEHLSAANDSGLPTSVVLSDVPLINVNGFENSTPRQLVHDMVDHAWLFTHLEKSGVMYDYADYLKSIDIGEHTFLYGPQMELIAGIGRGMRRYPTSQLDAHQPLVTDGDIINLLDSNLNPPQTIQGLETFRDMTPAQRKQARLVIESVLIDTAIVRAANGPYWQWADHHERRTLPWVDPMHISLVVEAVHSLQIQHTAFRAAQLATHQTVESFLERTLASGNTNWQTLPILERPGIIGVGDHSMRRSMDWFQANAHTLA